MYTVAKKWWKAEGREDLHPISIRMLILLRKGSGSAFPLTHFRCESKAFLRRKRLNYVFGCNLGAIREKPTRINVLRMNTLAKHSFLPSASFCLSSFRSFSFQTYFSLSCPNEKVYFRKSFGSKQFRTLPLVGCWVLMLSSVKKEVEGMKKSLKRVSRLKSKVGKRKIED